MHFRSIVSRSKKKTQPTKKKLNQPKKNSTNQKKTQPTKKNSTVAILAHAARSVQNFGLSFASMSMRDAPHQIIADLHGDLLREISAFTCVHWQGLGQAALALRKRNIIDGALTKKLILLDGAYNISRHITVISANQLRMSIGNSIKTIAATSCLDETQTDTATAPVDPSLAAPRAATASPSTPVSVIEHATLAPVDVYTKPSSSDRTHARNDD